MQKKVPPTLHLVPAPDGNRLQPSRPLGKHGLRLWSQVLREFDVSDVAGAELLLQACAACDRAEAIAALVTRDGEVIRTRGGAVKAHPGIHAELACRAFITRTLCRLGLDSEPIRGIGRPPGRGA